MRHLLLTTSAAVALVGCGNPDGALIQAIDGGNFEAVKQYLAACADVNAKNKHGWTPWRGAAAWGYKTAWGYKAGWGHEEIVELLITEGANVKDDGWTRQPTRPCATISKLAMVRPWVRTIP